MGIARNQFGAGRVLFDIVDKKEGMRGRRFVSLGMDQLIDLSVHL